MKKCLGLLSALVLFAFGACAEPSWPSWVVGSWSGQLTNYDDDGPYDGTFTLTVRRDSPQAILDIVFEDGEECEYDLFDADVDVVNDTRVVASFWHWNDERDEKFWVTCTFNKDSPSSFYDYQEVDAYAEGEMAYAGNFRIKNGVLLEYNGMGGDVTIPSGVTSIGEWAFESCGDITSVTIPNSVTSIGEGAFVVCAGLASVTIPNGVKSIGDEAFTECAGLARVKISASVTHIGNEAFGCCTNLREFVVDANNPSFSVRGGLLCDKTGQTVVVCPGAFTEVTIPAGVTKIGVGAFEGTLLTGLTVPDGIATLPKFMFSFCHELQTVVLPASLVSLGDYVFEECSNLTNVTFRGNAPAIGEEPFYGVHSSCTVFVGRDSTGWGVSIPGTWNGVRIEYAGGGKPPSAAFGTITVTAEATAAGRTMRLVFHRTGGSEGRIAVKVKTQTSTGICGTDFAYVKSVLEWEDGDASDKFLEIPTYRSGAGKQLRVKLAALTTGAYAECVAPVLAESKVYAEITTPKPGTITVTAPNPLSVVAGETLRMTFSRTGGSDGKIAVKAKTQTSTAVMGVSGSADFDYVKEVLEWGDGDATDRHIDIPTYVQPWEGVRMLRVKLATLATGAYAGNLTPALAESKIYAEIESPVAFGTVSVAPEVAEPTAGETLRLVFRRTGGNDYPIAVKYKVQTSTAIAGTDFKYEKGVVTWGDGEDDAKVVEVPTYFSAAGKQLRVKLSTLTQGAYEGCVTPHVKSAKVYVSLHSRAAHVTAHDKVQLWAGGPYWATTNIGAENPWESGYYFWWGDTIGYKWENSTWVASDGSSSNFSFEAENTPTYNKAFAILQREGWLTADGVLTPEHDAAHVHWGGGWRMPTERELSGLNSKCVWTWTTQNGVQGCLVKGQGAYASASIFLPCAGYGDGTSLNYAGSYGFYWSSVPRSGSNDAWSLTFLSSSYRGTYSYYNRNGGQSVRPVQGFTN